MAKLTGGLQGKLLLPGEVSLTPVRHTAQYEGRAGEGGEEDGGDGEDDRGEQQDDERFLQIMEYKENDKFH